METLTAYEDTWMRDTLQDAPDLTRRKYLENYPRGSRLQEWSQAVYEAARSGEVLSRRVLDDMFRRCGNLALFRLMHDFPAAIPESYQHPATRHQERFYPRASRKRKTG